MSTISVREYTYGNGAVIVYRGGRLSLRYSTKRGQFNLLSSEESLSCHISVYEDQRKLLACNVSPEYELDGNDPDEAVDAIEADIASHWIDTARDQKRQLAVFIKNHYEDLIAGNRLNRLDEIDRQVKRLAQERRQVILEARQ